jgi:hypothetical protein
VKYLLILFALVASIDCAATQAANHPFERELLGSWCAREKPAYHEAFMLENGKYGRTFMAFLHEHPAEEGTWQLRGNKLTIKDNSGAIIFNYAILSHSKSKLVLATERGDREYYFRSHCVAFGP